MELSFKDKSILVIGLGVSGSNAAIYLLRNRALVSLYDDKLSTFDSQEDIHKLLQLGACLYDSSNIQNFDLIVVSPGIARTHPLYLAALDANVPIMGEAELALCEISKHYKCIGITGTNGKTTVTYLLEHILIANGIPAIALGNSGIPLTAFLNSDQNQIDSDTIIIAELSSFQLETMQSPVLSAAIILNITEDHLDRYHSFSEYAQTKIHIFDCLKDNGRGYIEDNCSKKFSEILNKPLFTYGFDQSNTLWSDGLRIFLRGTPVCNLPEPSIKGKNHDLENILAAMTVALEMKVPPNGIMNCLASFKKPAHRLDFVMEIDGIKFVDDSKATNTDAVIRAVESIQGDIILLAGGVDKGGSYRVWKPSFKGKVSAICTIGQAATKIYHELADFLPIYNFKSLLDAVTYATKLAKSGDTILLSPGCSSYDMFSSYVHRGKHFREIVKSLAVTRSISSEITGAAVAKKENL